MCKEIMCGICGIVSRGNRYRPKTSLLEKMCRLLAHRGPDDEGTFVDGPVGLGARRLSIIDLQGGHQPMHNESRSVWLVFNGEIYNYLELGRELEGKSHAFRSRCDAEVVVHAYEQYGDAFVERLRGMFALAIWDKQQNKLILARDRIGIKPLYYATPEDDLVFASEVKPLLQHPGIRRSVNLNALDHYLTFEYTSGEETIFDEIRRLPPGHFLTYRDGSVSINKYWDLKPAPSPQLQSRLPARVQEMRYCEQLRDLIKESVRIRLRSDVPLGVFLSGGIDSSTVVALASEVSERPIRTFSVGFDEPSYDELSYARLIAERFGTQHHEFVLQPKACELALQLARSLGEPLADFSIFPTFMISRVAREHVKVALSGDGGDELFAGYETYVADRLAHGYDALPAIFRQNAIPNLMNRISPAPQKRGIVNMTKRFIEGAALPRQLQHLRWRMFLNQAEKDRLYSDDVKYSLTNGTSEENRILLQRHRVADRLAAQLYVDLKTYLPDNILVKVDRMSMANSLEVRVPFLDHNLVEFVAAIPSSLKLRGLTGKYILKQAMRTTLPKQTLKKRKQGFSIPIKNWLKRELKPLLLETLSQGRVEQRGLFNWRYVNTLIREHLSGRQNHSHRLWGLLFLELWLQAHLD
ncbi:MAG: asparagine synthase (glutamine-hydrolyzing) [Chlorobium sp.]|nr:asparagine synthase (glutamine-hydrolyzing) [Chlorobium sp.]